MTVVDDQLHEAETRPTPEPGVDDAPPATTEDGPDRDEGGDQVDSEHDQTPRRQRDEPLRAERSESDPGPVILPPGPKGMRIRRLRLKSVMKLASVFFVLGYLVTLGTLVALWNVAQRLGFVADSEDLIETSLGLDSFELVGQDLFDLAVLGLGILFAMGLVITVLLAVVYNAACRLFGGLAVETGPLRRPRKVFSLRHRRFIDVR